MNIFITGITGFIAKELVKQFSKSGHKVFGSMRKESVERTEYQKIRKMIAGEYFFSLGDAIDSTAFRNIDVVVHLAWDNEDKDGELNYTGALAIFEAAKKEKVKKQVLVSTYSAHEEAQSVYGKSKYRLEKFFKGENQKICKPGFVIGNGGLYLRMKKVITKFPIVPLLDGGKGLIPYVDLTSLAVAVDRFIEDDDNDFVNLFYPDLITLKEFVYEIKSREKGVTLFLHVPLMPIYYCVKFIELLGIPFLISTNNLMGLRQNQHVTYTSHMKKYCSEDLSIKEILNRI